MELLILQHLKKYFGKYLKLIFIRNCKQLIRLSIQLDWFKIRNFRKRKKIRLKYNYYLINISIINKNRNIMIGFRLKIIILKLSYRNRNKKKFNLKKDCQNNNLIKFIPN